MYYSNSWTYNNEVFTDNMIGDYVGFVYILTHRVSGQMYIGKKNFYSHAKNKITGKKQKTQSDWKKYYGSSDVVKKIVKQDGEEMFIREILHLCKTKRELNYKEEEEQFARSVLTAVDDNGEYLYLNGNIGLRHYRPNA